MGETAKIIIVIGVVLVIVGLVMLFLQKAPFPGKLPGDIVIKKENLRSISPLSRVSSSASSSVSFCILSASSGRMMMPGKSRPLHAGFLNRRLIGSTYV